MDASEVMEFFERRAGLIEGVVLSGGEPALQEDLPGFALELKRMGYKLKLDTNGSRPFMVGRLLREGLLDYVAMDYKAPLSMYPKVAGAGAEGVLETLALLKGAKVRYELRTTVIPELAPEILLRMAREMPPLPSYALQLSFTARLARQCAKTQLIRQRSCATPRRRSGRFSRMFW